MEEIKNRSEIPEKYKWDMRAVFASNDSWEDEYAAVRKGLEGLTAYAGKLGDADTLAQALKGIHDLSMRLEKLYTYASSRADEDNNDPAFQRLQAMARNLYKEFLEATAFTEPEMLALPEEYIQSVSAREDCAEYRVYLKSVLRKRPHTLSAEMEALMAGTSLLTSAPGSIYNMMTDADMEFPVVKLPDGTETRITHGNFIFLLENADREVRRQAWDGLYSTLGKWGNTLASTYSANVAGDIFEARARHYEGTLEAALYDNEIPRAVCDNLVESVHRHLPLMRRYIDIRRKVMGLTEVCPFDMYRPMVDDVDMGRSYEDACAQVVKSLAPMGSDYTSQLQKAFNERWIDVFENKGKTSGAYSTGVYGVHPYVLLNFQPNLDSLMTIAHEMGHAMHSWYSANAQPYATHEYTLFVAEVASTCNEMLVMRDLLKHETDKRRRAFLLNHLLEQFRTTLFRQTQFAEFEMKAHAQAEANEPLNKENLCKLYEDLIRAYYPGMEVGDTVRYEWMRIPHFYRSYYVYQYATGFSAAVALSSQILEKGPESYKEFLKLGGSLPPIESLKVAGIDMSTPAPVDAALDFFAQVLDEFEALMV